MSSGRSSRYDLGMYIPNNDACGVKRQRLADAAEGSAELGCLLHDEYSDAGARPYGGAVRVAIVSLQTIFDRDRWPQRCAPRRRHLLASTHGGSRTAPARESFD